MRATVEFTISLTFSPGDVGGDPKRYTGERKDTVAALFALDYIDARGYFNQKGIQYLSSNDSRITDEIHINHLRADCRDRAESDEATREIEEYINSCPYWLSITITLNRNDFKGDPPRYGGEEPFPSILFERGFMNSMGYLTRKGMGVYFSGEVS